MKRYTVHNGNGTYRIPLHLINGMEEHMRIEGNPPCIFGPLADIVGKAEDLGDLDELRQLLKDTKKGL